MANMMDDGAAWLTDQLFSHAAMSATYSRGGDSVVLNVVRAETSADLNDEFGVNVDVRVADFLIKQADLIILTLTVKPVRGDEVVIVIAGETITYEVLATITEDIYRESDRFGNIHRVHTKETGRT